MNQFEKYEPVGKIWTSLKNMNQLAKFKLVQKKFEPEVNLNHNICKHFFVLCIFYKTLEPRSSKFSSFEYQASRDCQLTF